MHVGFLGHRYAFMMGRMWVRCALLLTHVRIPTFQKKACRESVRTNLGMKTKPTPKDFERLKRRVEYVAFLAPGPR